MLACFAPHTTPTATPIELVAAGRRDEALVALGGGAQAFADAVEFKAKPGELLLLQTPEGGLRCAVLGLGDGRDAYAVADAPRRLPAGVYRLSGLAGAPNPRDLAFAWGLGAYRFGRYKSEDRPAAALVAPDGVDMVEVENAVASVWLARDLVNTPTHDMGPAHLEAEARALATAYGATMSVIVGASLLTENYPLIHAVGRAAAPERAPRLIELSWGAADAPHVVLVGKGVCFDTGGLDLKPSDGMRLMKKDMGGAANALALARRIMAAKLALRLTVLIPAVENAVDADAFRPGDILPSRAGLTVEVENTDAEGRLVLADALTRARELKPELVLDFATLTGAARVALGSEVMPFYTDDEDLADALVAGAKAEADPIWRMPLWNGYDAGLESPIADLRNLGATPLGGSITAALFLRRFAPDLVWAHFDIYAWNATARPGRPVGGEMQGARAAYAMLAARFPSPDGAPASRSGAA